MIRSAGELHGLRLPPHDRLKSLLEGVPAVARGVHERSVDVPEHEDHRTEPATLRSMFDALAVPPRLIARALDDLHTLAEGVRRLTDREGDLSELIEAVKTLPQVEDRLSQRIEELRADVQGLHEWLQPLHQELTDLDDTAEKLEKALGGLETMLRRLPGI